MENSAVTNFSDGRQVKVQTDLKKCGPGRMLDLSKGRELVEQLWYGAPIPAKTTRVAKRSRQWGKASIKNVKDLV